MINRFLICTLLFYCTACETNQKTQATGEEAMEDSAEPATREEVAPVAENKAPLEVAQKNKISGENLEEITQQIRKEYARIEKLVADNDLTVKKIAYQCPDDPEGGEFNFYFQERELLKATQSFYMGDHFGGESAYYFQKDQLFFAFHQNSSWTFAGANSDNPDEPVTRDDFKEQRDYFYQGKLINQLFKEYSQFSNQEKVSSNKIPNKSTGEDISNTFAAHQILDFSTKETLTCEMLNHQ